MPIKRYQVIQRLIRAIILNCLISTVLVVFLPAITMANNLPIDKYFVAHTNYHNSLKNDSTLVNGQQLIDENIQILSHFYNIAGQLQSIEESIRLMEIYNALQTQESINNQAKALKKTIKTRGYIAMGAGLVSSVFLLLNSDGNNNGLRYGGAALSFTIPVISFISMKKQINAIAPESDIDYSLLRDKSYPHNQNTLAYFQQTIKFQVFNLKSGVSRIQEELLELRADSLKIPSLSSLQKQMATLEHSAEALTNYFQFQYMEMIDVIENPYFIFSFDNGTREKLTMLAKVLKEKLNEWRAGQKEFKNNLNQLKILLKP